MKTTNLFLGITFLLFAAVLNGCSGDSDSDDEVSNGYTPSQIVGKTLVMKNNDGSVKLSAEHISESGVLVNNVTIDYDKYPPSYAYRVAGVNKATYHLEATKKTYIPYYGTYSYGKFVFEINLSFNGATAGTYNGTQTNANGSTTNIKGTFALN